MYLFGSQSYIQRKREIFHLLVHFSDGSSGQVWARPKPGTTWVSHVDSSVPSTWTVFCCICHTISRKPHWKWSSWDMNGHPHGMLTWQVAALLWHHADLQSNTSPWGPSPVYRTFSIFKIMDIVMFVLFHVSVVPSVLRDLLCSNCLSPAFHKSETYWRNRIHHSSFSWDS